MPPCLPEVDDGPNEADEYRSAVATLEERYKIWFLLPSGTYSGQFYLVFHSLFSCFEDTLVPGHE